MKRESLVSLSDEEVLESRAQISKELSLARFRARVGQLSDVSSIGAMRKRLARCNTELRRRELTQKLEKGALGNRSPVAVMPEASEAGAAGAVPKKSRFGLGFLRDALLGKKS